MKITPELLKKYAKEHCTATELLVVENWLLTQEGETKTGDTSAFQEEKLWNNIKEVMHPSKTQKPKAFLSRSTMFWSVAASFLLFISLGAYNFLVKDSFTSYTTLAKQKETITLPDGTIVHLNVASTLNVPNNYGDSSRTVELLGEGYFEVARDIFSPFIIETAISKTRVLGTQFNLSAYPDEATILTLNEGRVLFSDNTMLDNNMVLLPNEQAIIYQHNLEKRTVNASHFNGWVVNKLYFNNEPFSTISRKIERLFDVKIQIKNKALKKETYKGIYDHPSLERLLDDLSFVLKFKYKIKGKIVTIY